MKDWSFIVQCNDQLTIKINVVARSYERAIEYAKSAYSAQYATYADDRFNNWLIEEDKYEIQN